MNVYEYVDIGDDRHIIRQRPTSARTLCKRQIPADALIGDETISGLVAIEKVGQ